jgi:3-hydroxyacyl-CoA dehydrogenase
VVSGVCDGFIGNRMFDKYRQQAFQLLDEGATPQQVDAALRAFGFAMGPFAVFDLAGNDIGWEIRKRRAREKGIEPEPSVGDALCEQGRFGQKTGKGWYRYEEGGRKPLPDPEVDALLAAHRRRLGVDPRPIEDAEVVERCVYALANEGAALLEEGLAQRASDVDVVYLSGYGFPPFRGGPMFYADTVGLARVLETIERFQQGFRGELWKPAPLLRRLAGEGGRFNR